MFSSLTANDLLILSLWWTRQEAAGIKSSADLLRHARAAEEWEKAAQYAIAAAEAAEAIGARSDMISFAEQYLELLTLAPSAQVLQSVFSERKRGLLYSWLGTRYVNIGHYEQARDLYRRLFQQGQTEGSRYFEGLGLYYLGDFIATYDHDPLTGKEMLIIAKSIFAELGSTRELILTIKSLAGIALQNMDLPEATVACQEALDLSRTLQNPLQIAQTLNKMSDCLQSAGKWEAKCVVDEESVLLFANVVGGHETSTLPQHYRFSPHLVWESFLPYIAHLLKPSSQRENNTARQWGASSLINMGNSRIHLGEGDIGREAYEFAQRIVVQRKDFRFYHYYLLHFVWGWLESGEYAEAQQQSQQMLISLHEGDDVPLDPTQVEPQIALVDVQHRLFQLATTHSALERATTFAGSKLIWNRLLPATRWVTHHALGGDWSAAATATFHAQAVRSTTPTQLNAFDLARYYETEALLRDGEREHAQTDADALAAALGTNRRYRLMWLRMQALLDADAGDHAAATVHLREALDFAEAMGLPGERWPILGALAEQLAMQGDADGAHVAMTHAVVVIDELSQRIPDTALRDHFAHEARLRLPHR